MATKRHAFLSFENGYTSSFLKWSAIIRGNLVCKCNPVAVDDLLLKKLDHCEGKERSSSTSRRGRGERSELSTVMIKRSSECLFSKCTW